MIATKAILPSCFLLFVLISWCEGSFKERDKVLYKDLGTLFFSPGEKTRARRTYSVPQLVCMNGCHHPQPRVVQCTNTGWDGTSNLWKCKSDLHSSYSLDNVEIVCEGYSSPDDPYVTVGSCSLEYSIKPRAGSDSQGSWGFIVFVIAALVLFVLYKTCIRPEDEIRQNSPTNDNGPDDGQGPQMGWNIPGMNQRRRPGNSPGYGFGSMPRGDTCGNQANAGGVGGGGGGGGFWTGLAAGGALGYLFGGNNNRNAGNNYRNQASPGYFQSGYSGRRESGGLFSSEGSGSSTSESVTTARYRQR